MQNPKLTPELLLKNDSLVLIDTKVQRNYVQIIESGVELYQDISSPTTLMPNNAVINDTPDLQPFLIQTQRGKQIWLNIKINLLTVPNQYNLHVVVLIQCL